MGSPRSDTPNAERGTNVERGVRSSEVARNDFGVAPSSCRIPHSDFQLSSAFRLPHSAFLEAVRLDVRVDEHPFAVWARMRVAVLHPEDELAVRLLRLVVNEPEDVLVVHLARAWLLAPGVVADL